MLGKFFEHSLRCLAIFENNRDPREPKEAVELLAQTLLLFEPHVFYEVWASHMDFFVEQSISNLHVFSVLQMLVTHESVSHQLVGVLIKHLMSQLESLRDFDMVHAGLALRLFKTLFLAINTFINTNVIVLVPHLQKLIMDCFRLAAQSPDSAIYYQILRTLFR